MTLCECGCGNPAPIATDSSANRGYKKGQPHRFISGHNSRVEHGTLAERFWKRVNKHGPATQKLGRCWVCTNRSERYGQISVEGKMQLAHRVAWFIATGRCPNPSALHKCDNDKCVRFSHLFEGTQADNVRDMIAKGRKVNRPPLGEDHGCAKLTEAIVKEIRKRKGSVRSIAKAFGIDPTHVSRIKLRKSWKHVA